MSPVSWIARAVACLLASYGMTLSPVAAQAPVAAQGVQGAFDVAQSALDRQDGIAARDGFLSLWRRLSGRPETRSAMLVRARLGSAMLLTGQPEQAEGHLRAARAGFATDTQQDRDEWLAATIDLAVALETMGRLREARDLYAAAHAAGAHPPDSATDLRLRLGLIRTSIWADPDAARRDLDRLLALPDERLGSRTTRALLHGLRGRVELNAGNPRAALRHYGQAVHFAGGTRSTRVSVADVQIRSDLAIAYFLAGQMAEVQRLTAYSGQGSLAGLGLQLASNMPLPACAPAGDIAPDAMAIVEFGISDDGRAVGVTPIFASAGTGGQPGARPEEAFVAAVRGWTWNLAAVARMEPFWRQAIRVELRCLDEGPGAAADLLASFLPEIESWMESHELEPLPVFDANPARALAELRAELARRESTYGPASPQLVPALVQLSGHQLLPSAESAEFRTRLLALAEPLSPPPELITLERISAIEPSGKRLRAWHESRARALAALLQDLDRQGHGGTRPAYHVRVQLAEALDAAGQRDEARTLLELVLEAPISTLPAADPIRVEALIRMSNQAAARGDAETAAAALEATGLTPEQCATVDVRPLPVVASMRARGDDFPVEALRWGTAGFVRIAYDILPDGRSTNVRTITATPPLIFSESSVRWGNRFRFQPVFRPDSSVACVAATNIMEYQIAE
jgi:hypothetical protein